MWDIKEEEGILDELEEYEYYLNHVGYKVALIACASNSNCLYYLNHVGYKGGNMSKAKWIRNRYYLNHVGYKVPKRLVYRTKTEEVLSEPCGI